MVLVNSMEVFVLSNCQATRQHKCQRKCSTDILKSIYLLTYHYTLMTTKLTSRHQKVLETKDATFLCLVEESFQTRQKL